MAEKNEKGDVFFEKMRAVESDMKTTAFAGREFFVPLHVKPRCKPGFHLFNTEGSCCLCPAQLEHSTES